MTESMIVAEKSEIGLTAIQYRRLKAIVGDTGDFPTNWWIENDILVTKVTHATWDTRDEMDTEEELSEEYVIPLIAIESDENMNIYIDYRRLLTTKKALIQARSRQEKERVEIAHAQARLIEESAKPIITDSFRIGQIARQITDIQDHHTDESIIKLEKSIGQMESRDLKAKYYAIFGNYNPIAK
jgi:hypothetical protein